MCRIQLLITAILLVAATTAPATEAKLVVYSARNEQLIKPLFDAYTQETGVAIQFITDKEGALLQRLKAEGANTPADLLLTVDAGNLWEAARLEVLQPIESTVLTQNIPEHLRDPGKQWFGLSIRARTLFFNRRATQAAELSTYEDLGNPKWKNRLCLRTSKKVYNQSLVAMMIAEHGLEKTEQVVKSWVANLAAPPFADDTKMLEAVAAGQCDVGIANTYYYGRLLEKKPNLPVAIFWPNQQGSGVHVNISGAGVTRYAQHRPEAVALLEWLSSSKAQNLFADVNLEYPVNPAVKPAAAVAGWGTFKQNPLNVAKAGELQAEAVKLMDRAGYQ